MKLALVAILLAVAPPLVRAQDWTWQNPLPQGNTLAAVEFIDANNGWAVGAAGTVVHTSDGGATWTLQRTGTARDLVAVDFVDEQRGWAAGAGTYDGVVRPGPLLATSDGGQTWSVQTTSDFGFRAVGFGDASTGCALSDRILCTSDGGATWTDRGGRTAPEYLEDIQWLDAQNGWILVRLADGGLLLRTSDGGQNWSEVQTGSAQPLHALYFTSNLTGWVVGDNSTALRTDDGGTTWAAQFDFRSPSGTPLVVSAAAFQDVQFATPNDGWLVPERSNFIFHTSDGGTTWTQSFTGASWIEAVSLVDATAGWAVGEAGEIVRSSDGGITWTQQTPGKRDHFQAVAIIDEELAISGWVPGRIAPGKTSGGASWGPNSIIMTAWGNFQVNEDTDALCSYLVWYVASMPDFNSNLTEIMAVCGGPYVQAAKLLHGSGAGLGKNARTDSIAIEWTLHQTGETGEIHGATIVDSDHW